MSGLSMNVRSFLQKGVGAVLRWIADKLREQVSVYDFGAIGDGNSHPLSQRFATLAAAQAVYPHATALTDEIDWAACQAALYSTMSNGAPVNAGKRLYWRKGTFQANKGFTVGSNQTVEFEAGVTINLVPTANIDTTSVFAVSNQSNVFMFGNGAVLNGARALINPALEGNAAGFFLYGVDNFRIEGFNINNMATDGITLSGDNTGSGPCTDGVIANNVVRSARRNGISPISYLRVSLVGNTFSSTNGAPAGPWAGIDIEPNADCFAEGLTLVGNCTISNAGAGIQITPGALAEAGAASRRFSVSIQGGTSVNDGADTTVAGLYFANGGTLANQIYGSISVRDFIVDSPLGRGVSWRNWDADKCPIVVLDNVGVLNPDSDSDAANNYDRSGFVMYADAGQATATLGNVIMRDCWATDTLVSPWMVWGAVLDTSAGKVLKNIRIDNFKSTNFVAASKMDVATRYAAVAGGGVDVVVNHTDSAEMTLAGSGSIAEFSGKTINVTTSGTAPALPLAANCKGAKYRLRNGVGINSTSLTPQAGDSVNWYGEVAGIALVLDDGGYVELRSRGGTEWQVEAISGQVRRAGTSIAKKVIYASAAPTTGTWDQGDEAKPVAPAVGQPKGWLCTVGGTPGTWVSKGNL